MNCPLLWKISIKVIMWKSFQILILSIHYTKIGLLTFKKLREIYLKLAKLKLFWIDVFLRHLLFNKKNFIHGWVTQIKCNVVTSRRSVKQQYFQYRVPNLMARRYNLRTVKPVYVYNDHPRHPKIVAVVGRSLEW